MPDTTSTATPVAPSPVDMSRAVIEHALVDYGYSADTARFLIDRLIAEARAE
ncbi:hypothetical protein [Streptomyces sp. NBC_00338]|uniref:hypothetical protein n=1 Tax=Streptomyces sp. NBC_00338 TaxID=2975715 RepID=UPI00225A5B21|nr:hypothetical protein [Streptomyces sp. NBC_00338]MCX5138351.1 hypothetical protein [Streptomyces sp. NBC_00338]MCX5145140.1 hypothetical protein [Streptomyces sp. NBC_00338]